MQAETHENSSGGGSQERRVVSFLCSYCNHHARAAMNGPTMTAGVGHFSYPF